MLPFSRHLDLLAHDTMRVIGAMRGADPAAPVPGCPDWQATDLVAHLIEMNDIWGWLVAHRPHDFTDGYDTLTLPEDHRERLELLDTTNHDLIEALRASGADDEICYFGETAPAARAARLMAVETLVHSRDAEECAGLAVSPVPQDVAVDAADQQLHHLSDTRQAPWLPRAVTLRSVDTDDSWTVLVAVEHDDGTLRVVAPGQAEVGAEVSAPAAVLVPWLFGRTHATDLVAESGDAELVHALHLALGHDVAPLANPGRGPGQRRWWRR